MNYTQLCFQDSEHFFLFIHMKLYKDKYNTMKVLYKAKLL